MNKKMSHKIKYRVLAWVLKRNRLGKRKKTKIFKIVG